MARSLRRWRLNQTGLLADLSKFFNSAYLETNSMCYNMVVFRKDGDPNKQAVDYVCSRLFYGLTSSTALAQLGLELIANEEVKGCKLCSNKSKDDKEKCTGLPHQFKDLVSFIFVDDIFYSVHGQEEADLLMDFVSTALEKYSYKIKGWNFSLKKNSPEDPCLDADLLMNVGGNYYNQEKDEIYYKAPIQHNGQRWRGAIIRDRPHHERGPDGKKILIEPPELQIVEYKKGEGLNFVSLEQLFQGTRKTLKLLISKTNSHYDPIGLLSHLISQLRDSCRQATLFCQGTIELPVHNSIRDLWL